MIPQTIGKKHNVGKIARIMCVGGDDLGDLNIKNNCFLVIILRDGKIVFQVGNNVFEAANMWVDAVAKIGEWENGGVTIPVRMEFSDKVPYIKIYDITDSGEKWIFNAFATCEDADSLKIEDVYFNEVFYTKPKTAEINKITSGIFFRWFKSIPKNRKNIFFIAASQKIDLFRQVDFFIHCEAMVYHQRTIVRCISSAPLGLYLITHQRVSVLRNDDIQPFGLVIYTRFAHDKDASEANLHHFTSDRFCDILLGKSYGLMYNRAGEKQKSRAAARDFGLL